MARKEKNLTFKNWKHFFFECATFRMQKVVVLVARLMQKEGWAMDLVFKTESFFVAIFVLLSSTCHDLIFYWRDEKLHWTFFLSSFWELVESLKYFFALRVNNENVFAEKTFAVDDFDREKPQGIMLIHLANAKNLSKSEEKKLEEENLFPICLIIDICDLSR